MATVKQHIPQVFLLLVVVVLLYNALFSLSFTNGTNWRNVSVDTRVNITNAGPEILQVQVSDPITLSAGARTFIQCNITIRDYNGFSDIINTNATFYLDNFTSFDADSDNYHYTNSSCTAAQESGNFANYTCGFYVNYHAENGTWICNATTIDGGNLTDTGYNTTTINALLALNVTPLINYGNLSIGDTSLNQTADVTNIGNVPINVSVMGFGGSDYAAGRNLSFICDQGNISIEYEKYSVDIADDYASKAALADIFAPLAFTIPKQFNLTLQSDTTYWQLFVPPNPFGVCNGTVVFQAETST